MYELGFNNQKEDNGIAKTDKVKIQKIIAYY